MNEETGLISLHRLTQVAFFDRMSEQERKDTFQIAFSLLREAFPGRQGHHHLYTRWQTCEQLKQHVLAFQAQYEVLRKNGFSEQDAKFTWLIYDIAWTRCSLLDEADVFLEERSMSDLKRNSLVSAFLRVLEYYAGILILTSNRVGMLDEAFKSRIQVALHCENLNRSARKKIWQNSLDMLEEDDEDVNFGEIKPRLDDLAGKELNARQIRNVLTTARQLAIYRKERLDYDHLDQALSVSSDFSDIYRTHGLIPIIRKAQGPDDRQATVENEIDEIDHECLCNQSVVGVDEKDGVAIPCTPSLQFLDVRERQPQALTASFAHGPTKS
ncbi:MAG: hypothetical protein Q9173_005234 [Seirophora scorigena]